MDRTKHIFISKDAEHSVLLCEYVLAKNVKLTTKSLLCFEQILIPAEQQKTAVLFFASSRSFDFYISQRLIDKEEIACAGESTAKHIISKGYKVAFYPVNSGAVTDSSRDFSEWLGDRTVLFSISNLSRLSYSTHLEAEQFSTVLTYKTLYHAEQIPAADIYIFTSPSNVDAFLLYNKFPSEKKIIAWGETTAAHLFKLGFSVDEALTVSDDSALIPFLDRFLA